MWCKHNDDNDNNFISNNEYHARRVAILTATTCLSHNHVFFRSCNKHDGMVCNASRVTGHLHYNDVIMSAIASHVTSLTIVYSTVYSGVDQRKHQSSASLAFVWGIHRDRWIPRTKGQLRGKCFHLMTSSWWWESIGHRRIPLPKGQ